MVIHRSMNALKNINKKKLNRIKKETRIESNRIQRMHSFKRKQNKTNIQKHWMKYICWNYENNRHLIYLCERVTCVAGSHAWNAAANGWSRSRCASVHRQRGGNPDANLHHRHCHLLPLHNDEGIIKSAYQISAHERHRLIELT